MPVDPVTGTFTIAATTAVDVIVDVVGGYQRPTDTFTYRYDSTGLRASKTETGSTPVTFTWDTAGGLPLLLAQTQDTATSYLVYGPGGTPIYQITAAGTPMYYHHDHQGSTRLVTNPDGLTRGTLTYNPHGQITENTTPWILERPLLGYTGQYTDTETGYIYLRARYYDPATTQFTTQDPLTTLTHEPYNYAGNNPTNNWDPTGLCSVVEFLAGPLSGGSWFGPDPCADDRKTVEEAARGSVEVIWDHRDGIAVIIAAGGGIACVVGTAGTATVICYGATAAGLGLSAADSAAEGDWTDFKIDLGITAISFGIVRLGGGDEIFDMVIDACEATIDSLMSYGEAAEWEGY